MLNELSLTERRRISLANYSVFPTGILHPDRVLEQHDIIYMLEGEWEIWQDGHCYTLCKDEVIILQAGHHHYGKNPCSSGTKTMYLHIEASKHDRLLEIEPPEPTNSENCVWFPMLTPCTQKEPIKRLFSEIIDVYWSNVSYKNIEMEALLDVLLCKIAQEYRQRPSITDMRIAMILIYKKPSTDLFFD